MALSSFDYIQPADAIGLGLTPGRDNYLDAYDLTTADIPQLRAAAIEKYDNNLTGFIKAFSAIEELTANQYKWTELENNAITYDDAVLTVGATNVLTRAAGADVHYRLHEKVRLHTTVGAGVFIVTEKTSATSVTLGTYDEGSEDILAAYAAPLTSVYVYSLGIEVGRGSLGADFTQGLKLPYRVLSNIPAITRDVYTEDGSAQLDIRWAMIDGKPYWFINEIDKTRENFLNAVEKKHLFGEAPSATSDAASLGLQGTQGVMDAIRTRGAIWTGEMSTIADFEDVIDHLNKVQGSGVNVFFCSQSQEFAFDALGRTFNAGYGGADVLSNYIGEYANAESGKMLKLGVKGFEYGGYTFAKQGWKVLKDNTFLGNSGIAAADAIHFLMVPMGMTPVSEGDQTLAYNPVKTQKNYMTMLSAKGRAYDTWNEGGAWIQPRTNGDDAFKVHFLNESLIALFNAEKFMIGQGAV